MSEAQIEAVREVTDEIWRDHLLLQFALPTGFALEALQATRDGFELWTSADPSQRTVRRWKGFESRRVARESAVQVAVEAWARLVAFDGERR